MATRNEPINPMPGQTRMQYVYEDVPGVLSDLDRQFKMLDYYHGMSAAPSGLYIYHEGMMESEVDAIIAAHDPAFLKPNKAVILADGEDVVQVRITLPRTEAKTVTPTINGVAQEAETLEAAKYVVIEISAEDLVAGDVVTVGVDGHPHDEIEIEVLDAG
ncbi:hypothetical protein G4Y79_15340 [Phototrophicus methaneseepsis]|uniref:Uncharacterized protein n=1 Tax=Phototrophicus methaneseepsis TaxID=2710758 RepID=A0A7S8E640_9CHLR|nr:hypothetical protein [Phototrophicus methaneseepsis]QPC81077.1 hypothetical protein G4Y79_15340 [Phototrophicus methaneseepsis]